MADAKRQQRPPRTNGTRTRTRRSDARHPGIRHTSGQHSVHISLKKNCHSDTGIGANQRCDTPNCTESIPEDRENSSTQRHSADTRGPCTRHKSGQHCGHHPSKMDDRTGQSGQQQKLLRDMPSQDIHWPCEDNTTQYHIQAPVQ